jgi:hypothetical protein
VVRGGISGGVGWLVSYCGWYLTGILHGRDGGLGLEVGSYMTLTGRRDEVGWVGMVVVGSLSRRRQVLGGRVGRS